MIEQHRRAENIRLANNVAATAHGRSCGTFPCTGCGFPLIPQSYGFKGMGVTASACPRCVPIDDQSDPLRARDRGRRERARRIETARREAEDHFVGCVGNANAATARFRLYKPATESQRKALELALAYTGASWCLVLSGGPGVGKSHLAAARFRLSVRRAMRNNYPLPLFMTENEMAVRWRAGFRQGPTGADDVLAELMYQRVLYIDDLGIMSATGAGWIAALGQIIEHRHRHQLPTIITTNLTAEEIARIYGPRVTSRLAAGTCARVEGQDARVAVRAA